MAHHVINFGEQCKSCAGTGIYVGLAERDGVGVVCNQCNGTGCRRIHIEYDDFIERVPRTDVSRVVQVNPGIVIDADPVFGGMTYDEWAAGVKFVPGTEDRNHTCPAWWYQLVDYDLKPEWQECIGVGLFRDCKQFVCKSKCWTRWDEEHPSQQ